MAFDLSTVPKTVLKVASQSGDINPDSKVGRIKAGAKIPNTIRAVEKKINCKNIPKDFRKNEGTLSHPSKYPGTAKEYGHSPSNPGMVYYREHYLRKSPKDATGKVQSCYSYTLYEFRKIGESKGCVGAGEEDTIMDTAR